MCTLQNELIHPKAEALPSPQGEGRGEGTLKQRLAEAGNLLVKNLSTGNLVVANQQKALKQAKRNQKKYNAAARAEYVKNVRKSAPSLLERAGVRL